jgi:hypothetical protein
MISFNKFVASAGIATTIIFAAGWASAGQPTVPPSKPAATVSQSFKQAQADLMAAPDFCAVTYIMRDYTRGFVAVCELEVAE